MRLDYHKFTKEEMAQNPHWTKKWKARIVDLVEHDEKTIQYGMTKEEAITKAMNAIAPFGYKVTSTREI
jgi:hypothetical protein